METREGQEQYGLPMEGLRVLARLLARAHAAGRLARSETSRSTEADEEENEDA